MKKHGLLKIVGILLFLLIITTFFVPGRGSQIANIGIIDIVLNFLQSFYYFFDTGLLILVVAGLYGVFNLTLFPELANFFIISLFPFKSVREPPL